MMNFENTKKKISISSWNVHGLGDKFNDNYFIEFLKNDNNILLETWKGENKNFTVSGFNLNFNKIRKKNKRAKRHSRGIIILYKKNIEKGITYIEKGTISQNRLWLKLDKTFFGFDFDLYLCALYMPPEESTQTENDFHRLENEISTFASRGKFLLMGDFNARTAELEDFIKT
ncbi:unnamed protein product [Mytilus coruscus]|uniref:Endonuclease/exonuclease/phosphatase domain-containing protein n=1 Tax=Mytilus coruscus TaxID=42192 RepID=A0A6J8E9Z2_MYTCO|nr:unnamed protein product [Mytilus coruscus]